MRRAMLTTGQSGGPPFTLGPTSITTGFSIFESLIVVSGSAPNTGVIKTVFFSSPSSSTETIRAITGFLDTVANTFTIAATSGDIAFAGTGVTSVNVNLSIAAGHSFALGVLSSARPWGYDNATGVSSYYRAAILGSLTPGTVITGLSVFTGVQWMANAST